MRWFVQIAVLAMSGCQALNPDPEIDMIDADQSAIVFEHPDFDPTLAEYAIIKDTRTDNTMNLASVYGPKASGLISINKAGSSYVYVDTTVKRGVGQLFDDDTTIAWGNNGPDGRYQRFRIGDDALKCIGF